MERLLTKQNVKNPSSKHKRIAAILILFAMIFSPAAIDGYEYIDIVYLTKKPIVKGILNGKEAYFLLDTGSDITMLNYKAYQKYGFSAYYSKNSNLKINGIGATGNEIMFAYKVDMVLGSQSIMAQYRCYDLSNIVESIRSHSKIQIAGIIGSDVMKNYGFTIDYKNKLVGINVLEMRKKRKKTEQEI